jgi:hypothetical protein
MFLKKLPFAKKKKKKKKEKRKKRKKKKNKKKARVFTTWAGHVARMGEGGGVTGFWLGGPKVRDHLENIGEGGRITLSWTLGR